MHKSKSLVCGAGRQGKAIAYAMNKLGHESFISDKDTAKLESLPDGVKRVPYLHYLKYLKPDIVISALPYTENHNLAGACISGGFRYCDLGGNVRVSRLINDLADQRATKPVMTDLGLAPGLINLITQYLVRKEEPVPRSVRMYVGGLPKEGLDYNHDIGGHLKYGIVFSPEGLVNEYVDTPYVLEKGAIKPAEPMGDLHAVSISGINLPFEAFNTSGGAHTTLKSFQNLGVRDCSYYTLRYYDHAKYIRFLYNDCKLTRKELARAITNCCPEITEDVVVMLVRIDNRNSFFTTIYPKDGFTAMQRATAFPTAVVAHQISTGYFDCYKAVNYDHIVKEMSSFMGGFGCLLPEVKI